MIKDSVIELWDPYEIPGEYVSQNNNRFKRFQQKYTYTQNVSEFDVVQDDAFVSMENNREKIDPHRFLFFAKNFSCKKLSEDRAYFEGMTHTELPCICCFSCSMGESCDRKKYHPRVTRGYDQVGRVSSTEVRVMNNKPTIGNIFDNRFGNCAFCREMYFYGKHKYSESFFNSLANMHSAMSYCSIKSRVKVALFDGNIEFQGRRWHYVNNLLNPVCMPYNVLEEFESVTNFSLTSNKTYVFSHVRYIPAYMYAAKIAIKDPDRGGYFVNYLTYPEEVEFDTCDLQVNGVRFVEVDKRISEETDEFKDSFNPSLTTPLVHYSLILVKAKSYLLDITRYYSRIYLEKDGKRFFSL